MFILCCKKDPRLILCGAHNGEIYGDNSRHLYEWILKERPDIRAFWVTHNVKIYRNMKNNNRPVVLSNSVYGIKLLAKASVGIITNSLRDIAIKPFFIPKTLKIISLRHGKSIKKVRFAREEHKISATEFAERKYEGQLTRFAISTSDFISDIQEECMNIGREKHIVTGYPRNDCFFNKDIDKIEFITDKSKKYKRIILYSPTWRHDRDYTKFFPFKDFDKDCLVELLRKNDTIIILRPHKNELKFKKLTGFLTDLTMNNDEIKLVTHKNLPDINLFLKHIDLMLTDYSSIYHDFLLLNRPIIFFPYDYNDYKEQNGFLYDYFEELPGPAIYTFKEFCDYLNDFFKGFDKFEEKRIQLINKIHKFKDNDSCRRVMVLIDGLLNES